MTKPLVQTSASWQFARDTVDRNYRFGSLLAGCFYGAVGWIALWRQRKALGELATFDSHLLRDIGLTPEQALKEADKPFWRR